jgi:hypothetical protein
MKTSKEWEADIEEATRLERNFWQLVVLIVGIFGMLGGAGIVRLGACHATTTPIDTSEIRAAHFAAEVDRLRLECDPPVEDQTP